MVKNQENQVFGVRSILQSLVSWKSEYYKFIIMFGILFTILQIADLTVTDHASRIPKTGNSILFMTRYGCSIQVDDGISYYGRYVSYSGTKPKICKTSNDRMIYMYVFINMNNLYFCYEIGLKK